MQSVLGVLALAVLAVPTTNDYFTIEVQDKSTGRGVPLVELRTVNGIRYVTDSNGLIAFYEPGLMDQTVYFSVKSHGYEYPKDGFGYRGVRLKIEPGGKAVLKIERKNIAERLYRVTGAGIYRDSLLLKRNVPTKHPVLNAQVFGSDSVVNTIYRGKIYWFWGDTNRPSYPLGNFFVPGATSLLPKDGGLDPEAGVDLNYFIAKDGFAKPTAKMPGQGPAWIGGLVVVNDDGKERMFAHYVRVKQGMKIYERGLLEFDDNKKGFRQIKQFDMKAPMYPGGHPFQRTDGGMEYIYFADPYPLVRVPAKAENLADLSKYETYSCLKKGSRSDSLEVDRGKNGKLNWAWKKDTVVLNKKLEQKLIKAGKMKEEEGYFQFRDVDSGKGVTAHAGSVYWNPYRKRWVMIFTEAFGTSFLGEVWYSDAADMLGPWTRCKKIVTHDDYSFYNPKQHPFLSKGNGRYIFFEGTYTHTFSGNKNPTPRYDYNQIMYKLDLNDERLKLEK